MPYTLSDIFGSKKTPVETNTSAEGEKTVEIVGTVTETAERKFEWNLGRLFNGQEGHSQPRTWAVRVLSVLLVFPTVLTAIVDLGRGLGFLAGNKSETLGKIFTGKSFSLIDDVSAAGLAVADKVNAVYKSVTTPKTLTNDELNQLSEKAMKAQVNKLIDGYKALNGGYFHTNSSFSSPAALNGEKQIAKSQKELINIVGEYVARNVSSTEEFKDAVELAVKTKIAGFINAAAKDEFYVANKVERVGPQPLLKDVAFQEFFGALVGSNVIPEQFVALAKQESDVAQSLKLGVDQEIITPARAKQAIEEQASVVFTQALESGLKAANNAEKELLDSAVDNEIVTQVEAESISDNVRPTVEQLATAAAIDVVRLKTPSTTEEIVLMQLTKAADQLIENKKLDPKDKSEFFVLAQRQIEVVKDSVEANLQAQRIAQGEAELLAKQEAELSEAQRLAEVQKTEGQNTLLGKFKDILSIIARKQVELDAQFKVRNELDVQRQSITDLLTEIGNTQVIIKNKLMTVLEAASIYYAEKGRISNSKSLTDKQKSEFGRALADQGFDQKTINMINQLVPLDKQLDDKIAEMVVVSEKIDQQHKDLTQLIGVYNIYKKNNKTLLEEANRKEVKGLEKKVFESQKDLNTRHDQLLHRGVIARLRPLASIVNVDPIANIAEVDAIIEADKNAQQPEAEVLPQAPGGIVQTLWNLPGAVKRTIWG